MARGAGSPPLGSFKSRVMMRGLEVERAVLSASVEVLITALKVTMASSPEAANDLGKLVDNFSKVTSLESFTKAFREQHIDPKAKQGDLLSKLNRLNK